MFPDAHARDVKQGVSVSGCLNVSRTVEREGLLKPGLSLSPGLSILTRPYKGNEKTRKVTLRILSDSMCAKLAGKV